MATYLYKLFPRHLTINSNIHFKHISQGTVYQHPSIVAHRCISLCRPVREDVRRGGAKLYLLPQFTVSQIRFYTAVGLVSSIWNKVSIKIRMKYPKYMLRRSSLRLYLCCVELVDHDLFLREFEMPDTFNSWFRITELHAWMVMVRLTQEGKEGKFIRNNMMQFMWEDIEKKTRKLGENVASSTSRREGIQALSEQFKAILYAYDEGLLGDDKVLAGALWRNFFERNCKDVGHLEKMVEYVRKQLHNVDKTESGVILTSGLMMFTPLYGTNDALERNRQVSAQIMKRM